MRSVAAVVVLALGSGSAARADVDPPSKWVRVDQPRLGIAVKHPANAKLVVHGSTLEVTGPDLSPVTIVVTTTAGRTTGRDGGTHDLHVDWTITVPKRTAHCTATSDDPDKAVVASSICDQLELTPGPREPRVELIVTTAGLADGTAFERAIRGKTHALDACWSTALRKDASLPEGSISLARSWTDGQPASTDERHENFFDRDTRALAACMSTLLKSVPVKTAAPTAEVKLVAICHLY